MKNDNSILGKVNRRLVKVFCSDRKYMEMATSYNMGYTVDLDHPKTFNEKMAWLKLYDHQPIYHTMVDKYAVKSLVAEKIGEEYVVKPIAIFDSYKQLNFNILPPPPFVIKSCHYGTPIVIRTTADLDEQKIIKILKKQSTTSGYKANREWGYKDVKPRVMVEEYISDGSENNILQDYKFWCFNGVVKCMYVTIKDVNVYENFYDTDFNILDIDHGFPRHKPEFEKPDTFDEMLKLATKLSEKIPFVRVDFYSCSGKVYFGEYTFYDWAGAHPFRNYDMDLKIGSWLTLPDKKTI